MDVRYTLDEIIEPLEISRTTLMVVTAVRLPKGRKCLVGYVGADVSRGRPTIRLSFDAGGLREPDTSLFLAQLSETLTHLLITTYGIQGVLEVPE